MGDLLPDDALMDDIMAEENQAQSDLENWALEQSPHPQAEEYDATAPTTGGEGYEGAGHETEDQQTHGVDDHASYPEPASESAPQDEAEGSGEGYDEQEHDGFEGEPSPTDDHARRYTLTSTVTASSFTVKDEEANHRGHKQHKHLASFQEAMEDEEGGGGGGKPKKKGNPLGDNFMDFQWKKPNRELAALRAKAGLWQEGERKFMETSVHDFGDMSDGMELYFYVIRALVGLFFVLTLLSVPLLVIATAGNGGLAIQDAAFPAAQSLGNVGYNPDSDKAPSFCRDMEGDHKCVAMRYIFGLEVGAKYVTYVIAAYEVKNPQPSTLSISPTFNFLSYFHYYQHSIILFTSLYIKKQNKKNIHLFAQALISITMVVVSIWLLMNVEDKAEEINNEVSTPADFTVFVRNLPKDVSEGALLAHFSMR
jgi:hypothetical protein